MDNRNHRGQPTFRLPMLIVEPRPSDHFMRPVQKYVFKGPADRAVADFHGSSQLIYDNQPFHGHVKQSKRTNTIIDHESAPMERVLIKKGSKKNLISLDSGPLSPRAEPSVLKPEFTVHRNVNAAPGTYHGNSKSTEKPPNIATRQSFPGLEFLVDGSIKTEEPPHISKRDSDIMTSHQSLTQQSADINKGDVPIERSPRVQDEALPRPQARNDDRTFPRHVYTELSSEDSLTHTQLRQLSDELLSDLSIKQCKQAINLADKESEAVLQRIEFVEMDGDTKCRCWLGSLAEFTHDEDV